MPELPEVETVRKGLAQLITGKTIAQVTIFWENIVTTSWPLSTWCEQLASKTIHAVNRRGKYLVFDLGEWALLSHLRMEGKFHYYPPTQLPKNRAKHVHAVFTFSDKSQLHYEDIRKFGRFELVETHALPQHWQHKQLGPEPTEADFDVAHFWRGLSRIQRAIKPALLDQKLVVGLGNIYVDEVLFRANIHPQTPAKNLQEAQIKALHQAIIEVLHQAVEAGGSTIRTYKNSLGEAGSFQVNLWVYGRKDEPCVRCGTPITKIQLGGRGTHFCKECQPCM